MIAPHVLFPPFLLVFGWIMSLRRLAGAWHPHPASLLLFLSGLGLLVVGTQMFMRWLADNLQKRPEEGSSHPRRWRLKWTICGFGTLFCALLAITSFVLTTHQIYWISRSSEPWFVNVTGKHLTLLFTAQSLQRTAETNHWNLAETRAAFWKMESIREQAPAWEALESIWIPEDTNSIRAIMIVPRQPLPNRTPRFAVIQPGAGVRIQDVNSLPVFLASITTNVTADMQRKTPATRK
jgi:hypothetical protein